MKLTLNGETYSADVVSLYRVTIREAREIKRNTGMTLVDWRLGLTTIEYREDPDVLLGLLYVLKSRAGEVVDWDELNTVNAQEMIDGLDLTLTPGDHEVMDRALGTPPPEHPEPTPVTQG